MLQTFVLPFADTIKTEACTGGSAYLAYLTSLTPKSLNGSHAKVNHSISWSSYEVSHANVQCAAKSQPQIEQRHNLDIRNIILGKTWNAYSKLEATESLSLTSTVVTQECCINVSCSNPHLKMILNWERLYTIANKDTLQGLLGLQ